MSEDPDRLHLSLAPFYDATAAYSDVLVLQGTYPRLIHAFLESCASAKAPKSQWRSIKAHYVALIEGWQTKMDFDSWFRSEMADAEERILLGDKPEGVVNDLQQRFEGKYGGDADVDLQNASSGT